MANPPWLLRKAARDRKPLPPRSAHRRAPPLAAARAARDRKPRSSSTADRRSSWLLCVAARESTYIVSINKLKKGRRKGKEKQTFPGCLAKQPGTENRARRAQQTVDFPGCLAKQAGTENRAHQAWHTVDPPLAAV